MYARGADKNSIREIFEVENLFTKITIYFTFYCEIFKFICR